MRKLAPVFNTNRMVRDYAEKFYIPADVPRPDSGGQQPERSNELANAKDMLRQRWGGDQDRGRAHQRQRALSRWRKHAGGGADRSAGYGSGGIAVELYAGPITATGQIGEPKVMRMKHSKQIGGPRHVFSGQIECGTSGRQGFAVRVLPGNADLATPFEPGLIAWN